MVSPVYGAEGIVQTLVDRIVAEVSQISEAYEIILVEDGSPDRSWVEIAACCKQNPRVKGIKLSRNFGQHYAITAGLEASGGEAVVVMDCDLQDNPKYIHEMYAKLQLGCDIVLTEKNTREHSPFKNITARFFQLFFNKLNPQVNYNKSVGAYSLLSRKAVDHFLKVRDSHRHYLMILGWIGLEMAYVKVDHDPRLVGKSSYTFSRLISHALDGIVSQSSRLLNISIMVGFLFFILSILSTIYLLIRYFLHGFQEGWASTIVLILLSTGLVLMSLGVLGLYIGKTFEQVKNRPLYLVDHTLNF